MGGRPWSRGCGGARGPGAVAVVVSVLTSESRAWMGTELRIRMENEEGSYWARSPSHFPPLPIWAGKERKLLTSPGLLSSWFGGGEKRAADLSRRLSVGLEEGRRRGDGRRVWAFPGLSAGRVELGAWQPCRFPCLRSPGVLS